MNHEAFSRAKAIADGSQVDASRLASEAGIHFPVFLTRAVYDAYVTTTPNGQCGTHLWDIVWMLSFALRKATPGRNRLPFALYVRNDHRAPQLVKLIAMCGALDATDPRPAITVMLPDET